MRIIWGFVVAVALSLGGYRAQAQEVVPPEPDIEAVIAEQIEAFRVDDFGTAFGFASPGIQRMFGSPERFGAMVRDGYPMVWRPGEVDFGLLREVDGTLWQEVLITDQAGRRFGLAYRMEEIDGDWRIGGVQVIPAPDVAV